MICCPLCAIRWGAIRTQAARSELDVSRWFNGVSQDLVSLIQEVQHIHSEKSNILNPTMEVWFKWFSFSIGWFLGFDLNFPGCMSHLPLKNDKKHALPWRENHALFDLTTLKDSELIMWYPLSFISIMLYINNFHVTTKWLRDFARLSCLRIRYLKRHHAINHTPYNCRGKQVMQMEAMQMEAISKHWYNLI